MNKPELIEQIKNRTGVPKKNVATVLESFEDITKEQLAGGGEVCLHGFFKLFTRTVNAREYVVPKTGDTITKPSTNKVCVKLGTNLKNCVAQ